jgi:hypothetical protein
VVAGAAAVDAAPVTVPVAVVVWKCVPIADPVNVCVPGPVSSVVPLPASSATTVVCASIVPDGVPALTADELTELPVNVGALFVPLGVPPLVLLVVLLSPVNVGAATVPAGVWFVAPPVTPGLMPAPAPLMNIERKSGVPLVPSHRCQPFGMLASRPPHITITPLGTLAPELAGVWPPVAVLLSGCRPAIDLSVDFTPSVLLVAVFAGVAMTLADHAGRAFLFPRI